MNKKEKAIATIRGMFEDNILIEFDGHKGLGDSMFIDVDIDDLDNAQVHQVIEFEVFAHTTIKWLELDMQEIRTLLNNDLETYRKESGEDYE